MKKVLSLLLVLFVILGVFNTAKTNAEEVAVSEEFTVAAEEEQVEPANVAAPVTANHPTSIHQDLTVNADILVVKKGESVFTTQSDEVFKVQHGDTLNYLATIEAKSTQTYLNGLKAQLITSERTWLTDKRPGDKITLEDVLINF